MLGGAYHASAERVDHAVLHHERLLEERRAHRSLELHRAAKRVAVAPDEEAMLAEFDRLLSARKGGGPSAKVDRFQSNVGSILAGLLEGPDSQPAGAPPFAPATPCDDAVDTSPTRRCYRAPLFLLDRQASPGSPRAPGGPILASCVQHLEDEGSEAEDAASGEGPGSAAAAEDLAVALRGGKRDAQLASTEAALARPLYAVYCTGCGRPSSAMESSGTLSVFLQKLDASRAEKQRVAYERKIAQCRGVISNFRQCERDDLLGDFKKLKAENRFFRKERVDLYRKLYGRYLKQMTPVGYIFDDEAGDSVEQQAQREQMFREEMEALKERHHDVQSSLHEVVSTLRADLKGYKTRALYLSELIPFLEGNTMRITDSDGQPPDTDREDERDAQIDELNTQLTNLEAEYADTAELHRQELEDVETMAAIAVGKQHKGARWQIDEHSDDVAQGIVSEEDAARTHLLALHQAGSAVARLQAKVDTLEHEKLDILERLHSERVNLALIGTLHSKEFSADGAEAMADGVMSALPPQTLGEEAVRWFAADVSSAFCKSVQATLAGVKALQPHLPRRDAQSDLNDLAGAVRGAADAFAGRLGSALSGFLKQLGGAHARQAAASAAPADPALPGLAVFHAFPPEQLGRQESAEVTPAPPDSHVDVTVKTLVASKTAAGAGWFQPRRRSTAEGRPALQAELPPDLVLEIDIEPQRRESSCAESPRVEGAAKARGARRRKSAVAPDGGGGDANDGGDVRTPVGPLESPRPKLRMAARRASAVPKAARMLNTQQQQQQSPGGSDAAPTPSPAPVGRAGGSAALSSSGTSTPERPNLQPAAGDGGAAKPPPANGGGGGAAGSASPRGRSRMSFSGLARSAREACQEKAAPATPAAGEKKTPVAAAAAAGGGGGGGGGVAAAPASPAPEAKRPASGSSGAEDVDGAEGGAPRRKADGAPPDAAAASLRASGAVEERSGGGKPKAGQAGQAALRRALRLGSVLAPLAQPRTRTVGVQVEDLALQRLLHCNAAAPAMLVSQPAAEGQAERGAGAEGPGSGSVAGGGAAAPAMPQPAVPTAAAPRTAEVLARFQRIAKGDAQWLALRHTVLGSLTESVAALADAARSAAQPRPATPALAKPAAATPAFTTPAVVTPPAATPAAFAAMPVPVSAMRSVCCSAPTQTDLTGECTQGSARRAVRPLHGHRLECLLLEAEDERARLHALQLEATKEEVSEAVRCATDSAAQMAAEEQEVLRQRHAAELGQARAEWQQGAERDLAEAAAQHKAHLSSMASEHHTAVRALEGELAMLRAQVEKADAECAELSGVRAQLASTTADLERLMNDRGTKMRNLQQQVRAAESANAKLKEEHEKKCELQAVMFRKQIEDERVRTRKCEELVTKLKVTREASLKAAESRMKDEREALRRAIDKEYKRTISDSRSAAEKQEHMLRREIKMLQLGSRGATAAAGEYMTELKNARDEYEKLYEKYVLEKEAHYKTQDAGTEERRRHEHALSHQCHETRLQSERVELEQLAHAKTKKEAERRLEDNGRTFATLLAEKDSLQGKYEQSQHQTMELQQQVCGALDRAKAAARSDLVANHKMMASASKQQQHLLDSAKERTNALESQLQEARTALRKQNEEHACRVQENGFWTEHALLLASHALKAHRQLVEVVCEVKREGRFSYAPDEPLELPWVTQTLAAGSRAREDVGRVFYTLEEMMTKDDMLVQEFRTAIMDHFKTFHKRRLQGVLREAVGAAAQQKAKADALRAEQLQQEEAETRQLIRSFGVHGLHPQFKPDTTNMVMSSAAAKGHHVADALTKQKAKRPATAQGSGWPFPGAGSGVPQKGVFTPDMIFGLAASQPSPEKALLLPISKRLAQSDPMHLDTGFADNHKASPRLAERPRHAGHLGGPSFVVCSSYEGSPRRRVPGVRGASLLLPHHNPLNPHLPAHVVHSIPTVGKPG